MKVILTQDVDTLGQKGEVVEVKGGYGRNFLIPRGMAVVASKGNVKRYEEETRQQSLKLEAQRKDAESLAKRLDDLEIVLAAPVGEENRIFGTITTQQIADELTRRGIEVDRRKISLDEEIRTTGEYKASVRLHPDFIGHPTVQVVPESLEESL
ncbi:MAG: 50S ribosomal protein L9 [Rhodothermales bacterium]|nr:50S ribosomal protein L9 [Rhodothermales bacterium]